jgi:hypothetical protein
MNLTSVFDPLDYAAAVELVQRKAPARQRLHERIAQDDQADPFDALSDAEVLVELAKVRLRDALHDNTSLGDRA